MAHKAVNVNGCYALPSSYEENGRVLLICDFLFDPRVYLNQEDYENLEKNPQAQISDKTKAELLAYCDTKIAQQVKVWNFNAAWRVECPKTNEKFLDPLFEEIKKKYPEKQLLIQSDVTQHAGESHWRTSDEYIKEFGINDAQIIKQTIIEPAEISDRLKKHSNYIVIGDQAYQNAFDKAYQEVSNKILSDPKDNIQASREAPHIHRYLVD